MAKLKFGGEEYDYVEFGTLTLDEALVLHEYSGLTLDQVQDAGFHPGLIGALIHISVARGNPDIRKQDLRKKVGADLEQVFEDVAVDEEEDDARPPASPIPSGEPTEPAEPPKTDEPPESSGANGEASSENSANALRAIGSPG
jgi:hypothetical protein